MWEYVQMASFTHTALHSVKKRGKWFHSHFSGEKVEDTVVFKFMSSQDLRPPLINAFTALSLKS